LRYRLTALFNFFVTFGVKETLATVPSCISKETVNLTALLKDNLLMYLPKLTPLSGLGQKYTTGSGSGATTTTGVGSATTGAGSATTGAGSATTTTGSGSTTTTGSVTTSAIGCGTIGAVLANSLIASSSPACSSCPSLI
jgi:hypothetical protein